MTPKISGSSESDDTSDVDDDGPGDSEDDSSGDEDEHVIVTCGEEDSISLAITADGRLWSFGWREDTLVKDGTPSEARDTPTFIRGDIKTADAGFEQTLAVMEDGALWGWGSNEAYALAKGAEDNVLSPIKLMEDVLAAEAGYEYSMALKTDGSLWGWGENKWTGNLGIGAAYEKDEYQPVKIMG